MTRLQQVDIDLNVVTSTAGLHATLGDALGFPGGYGANWDAFWDAITGLVEMPVQLEFHGWDCPQALPVDAPGDRCQGSLGAPTTAGASRHPAGPA
ncbi:barstar family protein [Pseudomonas chlororaphis]|uniref:barstar family protein n=1 Tax=Pseudomonas chlororaphis TaxID=587753 RepID=UPI0003D37AF9|nr:barstar family protein [Pseudomonas chlororaphis]AZD30201.1 Barstar, ribonuclease (Barnase) inhibitor [Pseudomonas chlororaphis]ETD39573.1 ribonuclease inhibitor Barstar [Pseudomonas chlororaphis subsp. aurantiaca PB-St2]QFS55613.1 ribonuclease inhibitor [Pseudomonas chlororaphis subsp. aurantiaca]